MDRTTISDTRPILEVYYSCRDSSSGRNLVLGVVAIVVILIVYQYRIRVEEEAL